MLFITGATGFIGRSLTAALDREGMAYKIYNGRINDPITLRQELEGMHTVIHLAGAEARGRNRLLNHVDVDGTARLIEEGRRANIQRLIYVSRLNANPDAVHPLLRAKGEVERQVQRSRIPYTILRTASLYGRSDRFLEIIVSLAIWSWPLVWLPGGGKMSFQPLWVEDFVRCLLLTLNQPELNGKIITVAGEERIPYFRLVQQLLAVTELKRLAVPLPMTLIHPLGRLLFRWWYWPAVSQYFADRFFVPEVTEYDTVLRQFGFRPRRLRDNISYLRRPGLRWRMFRR